MLPALAVLRIFGWFEIRPNSSSPRDDPRQRQPDITGARKLLGWEPQVPLEEGLVQTIAYFAPKLTASKKTVNIIALSSGGTKHTPR